MVDSRYGSRSLERDRSSHRDGRDREHHKVGTMTCCAKFAKFTCKFMHDSMTARFYFREPCEVLGTRPDDSVINDNSTHNILFNASIANLS